MNAKSKIHQAKLAKWAALIKEQSESSLTVKEWCQQNNFTIHTYNYWKHLLKEEAINSVMPDIVPIKEVAQQTLLPIAPSHSAPVSTPCIASRDSRNTISTSSPVTISLGDVRIEIGSSASDDVIASIIKAVRHA
jgi:hypothetical protein